MKSHVIEIGTNMKTAVVFKWCKDPQDARVSADGVVSWPGVKLSPTDDDPAAMDVAKGVSAEADIVGITIGDGKPEWAAARGAANTVIVEDAFGGPDGTAAAQAIAAAVKRAGDVDIVTIGDSDWDRGVVSALVGALGWKAYANVTAAQAEGDDVRLTIKTPAGNRIVLAKPPMVIAAQALSQEANVPGMKQTLAARKKPVEKESVASLGAASGIGESGGTRLPEGDAAIIFDGADPSNAVAQLMDALRGEGVL
ncbi:electron transfer flavoprotein subunit alpha [Adlercreutzia sp. ZJ138]|uniref:electron transfer flavoprotein subunit alpha n=1 Tax=Adlercreutzia sp. ZJ138 TaxID=2709405 RepID=UPI0013EE3200|nr:electron transfer flavoprotein subunit alpha [Adlercreutzia sp. ZJ138]